jgi:hypothetical protein
VYFFVEKAAKSAVRRLQFASAMRALFGLVLVGSFVLGCSGSGAVPSSGDAGPDTGALDATGGTDTGAPPGDAGSPPGDAGTPPGDAGQLDGSSAPNPLAAIARDGNWHFVAFDGAVCADGSGTGIGVNFTPQSEDVLIHLAPGGGCWDGPTCAGGCATNVHTGYDETHGTPVWGTYIAGPANLGLQSRSDVNNPFAAFNYIDVFYCTGDVHAGDNVATSYTIVGQDGGVGPVHHKGHANLLLYVAAVLETFPNAKRVVLAGLSAGGFGSYFGYDAVARVFAPRTVYLIDDSGPILQPQFDPPSDVGQSQQYENWGLAHTLPAGCTACDPTVDGGGPVNLAAYLSSTYPEARMALLSSLSDDDIRQRYELDGGAYAVAIQSLGTQVLGPLPTWRHFFAPGSSHTMIDGVLEDTTVCGVATPTFNGTPCAPTLATFLEEMLDAGGAGPWQSMDPMPGAPGKAFDAGNGEKCDFSQ